MNSQTHKIDFNITLKLSLNVCKFVNLFLLIRDIRSITSDVLDSLVLAKLYSADNRYFSKPVINRYFSGFPVKSPSNKALGTRSNCKISGTEINRDLAISTCFWEMAWIFAFLFSLDGLNLADSLDF